MRTLPCVLALLAAVLTGCSTGSGDRGWQPLFPADGVPAGWSVRAWNDVALPGPAQAEWRVTDGVLRGGEPRGTWLLSDAEYEDFELEFSFRLGPRGNSGLALRAPGRGDPAFDGLELQMADLRYNPEATDAELTGGLYRALAPRVQVYRPEQWNHYAIRLVGDHVVVRLNGVLIQDVRLAAFDQPVPRHDSTMAPPLRDRPRRGHLGFQELSRAEGHVEIRDARIRVISR